MKIAFDVDDTLIIPSVVTGDRDIPNYEVIAVYRFFQAQGCHMIIWSGSGIDWATTWGEKLGLKPNEIRRKQKSEDVDIAFDDCQVDLGKVNVRVGRVANNISREIWNKTKRVGCKVCESKSGSPTLCKECLIERDGICEHGNATGYCIPCYEIQR